LALFASLSILANYHLPLSGALGAYQLKALPYAYVCAALYCLLYLLIWFVPFTSKIIGSDGSWYFGLGIVSLWVLPLFIVGWVSGNVRSSMISRVGKNFTYVALGIISLFFLWGISMLLSLEIYGV